MTAESDRPTDQTTIEGLITDSADAMELIRQVSAVLTQIMMDGFGRDVSVEIEITHDYEVPREGGSE